MRVSPHLSPLVSSVWSLYLTLSYCLPTRVNKTPSGLITRGGTRLTTACLFFLEDVQAYLNTLQALNTRQHGIPAGAANDIRLP